MRLFDDGFLRLFAQPSEQAFFLTSRSWGLLVVVGTKHGGRLSHGSDAPHWRLGNKLSMQNRLQLIQLVQAQHFVDVRKSTEKVDVYEGLERHHRRKRRV
ncbi:hypothetical protein RG836_05010 [Pseudomonas sp. SZMC_28357]|uniref:hypothetical protein n=1 Tax=Pseudomonas sp. SZMC_28357 TaxID=3074380 RepID=UPI0028712FB2|nr:hypothetical protein [Pseudomonas sp. SZMC_28357]MDR9750795.1 hypothetical protein [Pseudomonas sp. SZMC_28357]